MGVILNPQQQKFKEAYCNPNSSTFGNAYQSALVAEYSDEYAKNITGQGNDWLSEILRDREMLGKAEKVLNKTLDLESQIDKNGMIDSSIEKVRLDAAKFVAETLGKEKYSKQSGVDLTSGGEPFKVDVISFKPKE